MAQAVSYRPLTAEARVRSSLFQWPRGLRRGSRAARLLGLWVRIQPIPVAVRSKAWVFGRSLIRIVGSNPTGGMDDGVVFVV